jgi:Xaa-Pro dipeptidase
VKSEFLERRFLRLSKEMEGAGLDGVVIAPGPNMFYFTGVKSVLLERPFMLFVSKNSEKILLCPKLEAGPYRNLNMTIYEWSDEQGPLEAMKKVSSRLEGRKWGVEGRVPFSFFKLISSCMDAEFVNAQDVFFSVREVKDENEIKALLKASRILSKAFVEFPGMIKEGMKEKELAKKTSDKIYSLGAEYVDNVLVQSGHRASDPHSLPSDKRIARDELIVIDISCTFSGYYSDVTRTLSISRPKGVEKAYQAVLEAQLAAENSARAGVKAEDIDREARSLLDSRGFGKYFIHRTGHGLGLEVHESPFIVSGNKKKISQGMFFTVEPGVYFQGKFGIRIEDDIFVSNSSSREITNVPKEFLWWL